LSGGQSFLEVMHKFEVRLWDLECLAKANEDRITGVQNLIYSRLPEIERKLSRLQTDIS